MKYKIGDIFPAHWESEISDDDGDYWSDGVINFNGKRIKVSLYVTNIVDIVLSEDLPRLESPGTAVVTDFDQDCIYLVPGVWTKLKDPPSCYVELSELED